MTSESLLSSIDEGITGYRDPGIAKGIAGSSGTECIRVSFPERLGMTVDEIAHQERDRPFLHVLSRDQELPSEQDSH